MQRTDGEKKAIDYLNAHLELTETRKELERATRSANGAEQRFQRVEVGLNPDHKYSRQKFTISKNDVLYLVEYGGGPGTKPRIEEIKHIDLDAPRRKTEFPVEMALLSDDFPKPDLIKA